MRINTKFNCFYVVFFDQRSGVMPTKAGQNQSIVLQNAEFLLIDVDHCSGSRTQSLVEIYNISSKCFKKFVRHWGYFHLVSSFLLIKDFQFFFSPGIQSFKFLFNRLKFKMLQSYSRNSKVRLVVINFIKLKRIGC